MNTLNIEAINRLNISNIDTGADDPAILWIAGANSSNRDTLTFRFHTHTFFEIHFITEGNILYGFENGDILVEKGKFILISPNQIHRVVSHSESFFKITVAFELSQNSDIYAIINGNKKKIIEIPEDIQKDLDFILFRAQIRSNYSEILIQKRTSEIIYLLADSMPHQKTLPPKIKSSDDRVLKAKKYIEDNSNIFFTCNEVARYCKLSAKQLGRLFEQYEGKTVLEFIHEQKIISAKRLLLESDDLQETICKKLGFSSVHYFNKFFISHTKMTPSEYRKSILCNSKNV